MLLLNNCEQKEVFMKKECADLVKFDRGRILGLDIGDTTVGISVSDEMQMIASSVSVIRRTSLKRDFAELDKVVSRFRPIAVIYGWPLQTNGQIGSQCEKVEEFISNFEGICDLPLVRWDERFSTKITNNVLISADLSRNRRKKVIDKVAATYILQGALDFIRNARRNNALIV